MKTVILLSALLITYAINSNIMNTFQDKEVVVSVIKFIFTVCLVTDIINFVEKNFKK